MNEISLRTRSYGTDKAEKNYKKNNIITLIGVISLKVVLELNYLIYTVPYYGYIGFFSEKNTKWMIISWIILFAMCPFFLQNIKSDLSSSWVLTFLFLFSAVPFTVMVGCGFFDTEVIIGNTLFFCFLFSYNILFSKYKVFFVKKRSRKESNNYFLLILSIISIGTVFVVSAIYTGLRIDLSLDSVYEYRMEARGYGIPTIIRYIHSNSRIINIIMLIYFLNRRCYYYSSIFLLTIFVSFSISGLKSLLLMALLAMFITLIYSDRFKFQMTNIVCGFAIVSLFLSENSVHFLNDYIIRRLMFVPNMLNKYYFEYFTENAPDFYRQSFLRHLGVKSPYETISRMIGDVYFGRQEMNANTGLIADAITNLGLVGIVVTPLLICLFLSFYDMCTANMNAKMKVALGVYIAYFFISTFLFTALMTHGLLIGCILLAYIKRE